MKKLSRRAKRIIWRVVVILVLLSMAAFLSGQQLQPNQKLHQDFGVWTLDDGQGNTIGIQAYATVENITKYPTAYNQYEKGSIEPYTIQRYELWVGSKSVYRNNNTATWINGARVYIDFNDGLGKREMTAEQFPDGFIMSITVEPMLVYWYEIEPVAGLGMYISWENAIYETRIRN